MKPKLPTKKIPSEDEFRIMLTRIVELELARDILAVPGVYAILSREYYDEVIEKWNKEVTPDFEIGDRVQWEERGGMMGGKVLLVDHVTGKASVTVGLSGGKTWIPLCALSKSYRSLK